MTARLNDVDAEIRALEQQLAADDSSSSDGETPAADNAVPSTSPPSHATLSLFSVHAGETVHFSGRKPGDAKPKRGAKKRARAEAEAAASDIIDQKRWRCDLCSVEVNSQALLEEHRDGWKHAEKVQSMAARAAGLYCETCSMAFTGMQQLEDHNKGGRHRAMVAGSGNSDGKGGKGHGGGKGKGMGKGKGRGDGVSHGGVRFER